MIRKRILLGLDTPSLATAMAVFANEKKFEVVLAEDGNGAFRGAIERVVDMAILDMSLGWDARCTKLKKELSPATLVVLLVSADNRDEISRCLDGRCDAIIVKPLTYGRLSSLVSRLLFSESKTASRLFTRIPVQYGTDPDALTESRSVDLTAHGMFVETQSLIPAGTTLHLSFDLDTDPAVTIRCTARVAWINSPMRQRSTLLPSGVGVEFMHMAPLHSNAIRDFLFAQRWSK